MRKILLLNFLIFQAMNAIYGQKDVGDFPLHEYKFSQEIETGLQSGEMRIYKAAQYYSYIGEYQKALSVPNEVELAWGFDSLTQKDIEHFKKYVPYDAFDAILEQAKNERIIIINEAHHKPIHRIFTRQLLRGLYNHGYNFLGLEALANCETLPPEFCDSLFNKRGFVWNSPISGTYVTEPQMSHLISKAHDIGYELFAYEGFGKYRELNQAQNIAKVLMSNPKSKIIIHCGWYHLLESKNKSKIWMASYLKELTGIDPFTIYQDILIERNSTKESPFFEMMNYEEPKVFINSEGEFYNGKPNFDLFNVLVYHPRTQYIYNRPNWLVNYDANKLYWVKDITIKYPCLIKAYKINRSNKSVALDIIEKQYENDNTPLVLPNGEYRLELSNIKGEKQIIRINVE